VGDEDLERPAVFLLPLLLRHRAFHRLKYLAYLGGQARELDAELLRLHVGRLAQLLVVEVEAVRPAVLGGPAPVRGVVEQDVEDARAVADEEAGPLALGLLAEAV